jgi:hypothetical protein
MRLNPIVMCQVFVPMFSVCVVLTFLCSPSVASQVQRVSILHEVDIQFSPGNPGELASVMDGEVFENGRVVRRNVVLPEYDEPVTIKAQVAVYPVAKDERNVYDKWDRAGDVRLVVPDGPPIEMVKFVTSYGGFTEFEVDVSHLAPLLRDECVFEAFVDTWVSPAWQVDFELLFTPADTSEYSSPIEQSVWVEPVMFVQSYNAQDIHPEGIEVDVDLPPGADRVLLYYYVSGHCTDGRGGDEFVTKDNVIRVNDVVVYRFRPWRDDCRDFRAVNPYTARWSDGWWSSDFSRSGWCPGDVVEPLIIDLSDHLVQGRHRIGYAVEDVRPIDSAGHFGYWRVSSYVVGMKRPDK